MSEVKFNVAGTILAGDDVGWTVRVIDDSVNTGGYLVLVFCEQDKESGWDSWVETLEDLDAFFEESGWVVSWHNP